MKLLKKDTITTAAALVAGSIGANLVYNKATMITNTKLRAAAPLVLGLVLSGQKNKMIQGVGFGMIAAGGQKLVGSFVPGLAGIEADEVIEGIYDDLEGVNGADDVINGPEDVINGFEDEINGMDSDDEF